VGRSVFLLFARLIPAFEIGGVPAGAFERNASSCELFAKRCRFTFGALGKRRIRQLLHDVVMKATRAASISIDGHYVFLVKKPKSHFIKPLWA
jgi:hypothetical protein